MSSTIRHIAIVGSGRAAAFFAHLFASHGLNITAIISRNAVTGNALAKSLQTLYSPELNIPAATELVMVCVHDDEIKNIASSLEDKDYIVCHCAGAADLNLLSGFKGYGVIYPLQSLGGETRNVEVPFLLEANLDVVFQNLQNLLQECGQYTRAVNSRERRLYHLAAVFANNFTNAMLLASEDLASGMSLDFNLLKPLIQQTFARIQSNSPSEVQTGPAMRGDKDTMAKHLALLSGNAQLQKLYTEVSAYIQSRTGKNQQ